MALGRNVGKLMKLKGLGYAKVARDLGLEDKQQLWQLVQRDSKKSALAGALATYFGVSLEDLFSEDLDLHKLGELRIPAKPNSDAEKLLVLVKTFLDTDAEGRNELVKIAEAISGEREQPAASRMAYKPRNRGG